VFFLPIHAYKTPLATEITGLSIGTDKFKTNRISLSFLLPLTKKDAAMASLLSRLLSRSTGAYPTPVDLHRKLLSLYGAVFSSGVLKLGDCQLLNISITTIADRFALENEPLAQEATDFLCDALFHPNITDGAFVKEDLEICRRLLIETMESTINDKRKYAISKMYASMCKDEPFGVEIGGDIETVQSISGKQIVDFWQKMLTSAPVIVTVVGNQSPEPIYQKVTEHFNAYQRNPQSISPSFAYQEPSQVQNVEETMQLTQGKLVMGFRSTISTLNENNMALRMMCDIFGGAPYSKLFTVVREKMSLCYYCAARLQSQKGFICVDSGVDESNIEATKQGIIDQLTAMQQGDFDDSVIEAAKMSLADGARSVTDSQEAMESWYLARLFDKELLSPDEFIQNLQTINKEQISAAAATVKLDTVYILKGKEEAK
jgi:predicted Zn-dependent peptidase